MSDDHTRNAASCYGGRFAEVAPTPHIDRIAAEGARLENCYAVNSICVPSRASILTGLYSHRNGVKGLKDGLDPARPNVAKALRAAGYETAIFGKWHLKKPPSGFDAWRVLPGQGRYFNPQFRDAEGTQTIRGHSTDIVTDLSIDWLKRRSDDKPFFLMCHFKAPHEAWQYADRYDRLFEDTVFPEPGSLFEDQAHRSAATRDKGYTIDESARRPLSQKGAFEGPRRLHQAGARRPPQGRLPEALPGLPPHHPWCGRQRGAPARAPSTKPDWPPTPSSSTPPTRATFSANTATSTSAGSTRSPPA